MGVIRDDFLWNNYLRDYGVARAVVRPWWMSSRDFFLVSNDVISLEFCNSVCTSQAEEVNSGVWYNHQNLRTEKVECFAENIDRGIYWYEYKVRARVTGTFAVPPSQAKLIYFPTVRALSPTFSMSILE